MVTRNTEYAFRALVYIQLKNFENIRPGVSEISREIDAPEAYLAKIMQTLSRHRIVDSRKGRGGGFYFPEGGSEISLYDVILIMEGDACFKKCAFGFKNCSDFNPCPLHDRFAKVREDFLEITRSETIRSVTQKILDGKATLRSGLIPVRHQQQ
jgi:Rrf2 family protein